MRIVRAAGLSCSVLAFLAFLAFPACNAILGNESDYRLVPTEAGAPSCESRDDCPTGQLCFFGACRPACLGDLDCQAGVRCLRSGDGDAGCVAATAARCTSGQCPEGLVCSRGACRNRCATSDDCLTAQQCVASATISIGNVCIGTDATRDPDAVETDAGTGGAPNTGGRPGSGGRPSNTGGRPATGGAGGQTDAGNDATVPEAGPCVASGPESCFNGVDDDCNGETDCADGACSDRGRCVPDVPGATLGTFLSEGGSCPQGYTAVQLHRGLDAPYGCNGCSCVPNDSRCESGIYGLNTCPGFNFKTPLYNVFSHQCLGMAPGTSIHYYNVRGFATCTPQGTGTPPPATWSEGGTFCVATQVGGGCARGNSCVPIVATPACTMTDVPGSCAPSYPTSPGNPTSAGEPWYEGLDDARECPACSCSFGSATCSGAYIAAYDGGSCTGNAVQIGNGAEGDNCSLPFAPVSGRVIGTPTNPSCPPNTFMSGEATPKDPHTVCCR